MAVRFGEGDLRFEFVDNWEQKPARMQHDDVSAVCTDSDDNVYLFCRGRHPVMVYDREGRFIDAWGEGEFDYVTGGMFMTDGNELFLGDDGGHAIRKYSTDGKLLQTLGPAGVPSDSGFDGKDIDSITRAAPPYNRPARAVVAPNKDIYVADGEGNCCVHRFSPEGALIESWGEPGTGPGQFKCVHSIWAHADGRLFVTDRQNDRIQIFSAQGEYLSQWTDIQRPHDIFIDDQERVYVCESFFPKGAYSSRRGRIEADEPARMSIFDIEGNLLLRWTDPDPFKPGYMHSPHGIWVDSQGSLYVANNSTAGAKSRGAAPMDWATQKFVRV